MNKSSPQSPAEYLAEHNIIVVVPEDEGKSAKRARNEESLPATVATTNNSTILSTLSYTPIIPIDYAASLSNEVHEMILETTKNIVAEEIEQTFSEQMKTSLTTLVENQVQHQEDVLQEYQRQLKAQAKSIQELETKFSTTDENTQERMNILGQLVQANQDLTRKTLNDHQSLMLHKFAEADAKADNKFAELMAAFNASKIHTTQIAETQPKSPTDNVNISKYSPKKPAAKTKTQLKHQVIPPHYINNPYRNTNSNKPKPEKHIENQMLDIIDE